MPTNDKVAWSDAELRASVTAYMAMLQKERSGLKVVKKEVYAELSRKYGRTTKSIEYRMQNISYVLSLLGRKWVRGLQPARNVGASVAAQIESLVAELEGRTASNSASFEIRVNGARKQTAEPVGNIKPSRAEVSVTKHVRDPGVKAWVLNHANGICECCSLPAPFAAADGPFLEVHHVHHLADDGPDTIFNAIAICPNCHRRLHYSLDAANLVDELYLKIDRLVRGNSKSSAR